MAIKNQITRDSNVSRQFNYEKEKVSLKFSLRIDIKNELKCFKELLEAALEDVNAELTKHK